MSILDTEVVVGSTPETDLSEMEEMFAESLRSTHIVTPVENKTIWMILGGGMDVTGQDIVDFARKTNSYVVAICEYKWIPKNNPEKYDLCEHCRIEAEHRMRDAGE